VRKKVNYVLWKSLKKSIMIRMENAEEKINLNLTNIRMLLYTLGNPQDFLSFVHVAGTNGKGSVSTYISNILSCAGYTVGKYTSPAVQSKEEQIQINEKWISSEEYNRLKEEIRHAGSLMSEREGKVIVPTPFEIETAMALLHFYRVGCDIVVLEAGLGGQGDATNVIKNTLVAVLTSISKDHMEYLGESVEEIAKDEAGVIKPGCIVVSAWQEALVECIIVKLAAKTNCPVHIVKSKVTPKQIQMLGIHQLENAGVAVEAIKALKTKGYPVGADAIKKGLAKAKWFGRFQKISVEPTVIIDGAHNVDAVRRLKQSIQSYFPKQRLFLLVGIFKDKEIEEMLSLMLPIATEVYTVTLPDKTRSVKAEALRDICTKLSPDTPIFAMESVTAGIKQMYKKTNREDVIVAFGSLSYLAAVAEQVAKERSEVKSV